MGHNELPLLVLPCRFIIPRKDGYHQCSLMNGSVCQALNYNLTDTTIKGVMPILWDLRGQTVTPRLDPAHAEITERIDPEAEFNLDEQCPAGYSWKEVNSRFDAFVQQLEDVGSVAVGGEEAEP